MASRLKLHEQLTKIAEAYYQPPSSIHMQYPCFVYHLAKEKSDYADNIMYRGFIRYTVTYITLRIHDEIIREMHKKFKYCSFDREYTVDGLHHYSFDLFY